MEAHKFSKPHFSQSCERLLDRIKELQSGEDQQVLSEQDANEYWAHVRDQQEVHEPSYVDEAEKKNFKAKSQKKQPRYL
jgi:hypothetical protein